VVGDDAVDLLGHPPVSAAQPGLQVRDGHVEIGGHQGGGQRAVDVAGHDHEVRLALQDDRLKSLQQPGGLRRLRARADTEIDVGLGQAELVKEDIAERCVVVLPGVHERLLEDHARRAAGAVPRLAGGNHRRDLDEVGPRADHVENAQCRRGRESAAEGLYS